MDVKIDTKERFHVILIEAHDLTANMTDALGKIIQSCRQKDVKNIILNLSKVTSMDPTIANFLLTEQQRSYDMQHSFVICCLEKNIEKWLDEQQILEMMNVTPTESEAWDIVQMEEIEREFLDEN